MKKGKELNTNTEVTLYDFLNYEVIGVLMLFLCKITPQTISLTWLFFVFAFIEGFVFSKLVENSFWTKYTRNSPCLIKKARKIVHQTKKNRRLKSYYKSYYSISKNGTYKTVQILEAQYAFVHNLFFVCIAYLVVAWFHTDYFDDNIVGLCNCCKQCVVNDSATDSINLMPIIVSNVILLFCCILKWISCPCLCERKNRKKRKRMDKEKEQNRILIKATFALVVVIFFFFIIRGINKSTIIDVVKWVLLLLLIILPFLAYRIQLKISTLVIEGGYYLKNQEDKKYY